MHRGSSTGFARNSSLLFVCLIAIGCARTAPPSSPTIARPQASLRIQAAPVRVARTDKTQIEVATNETVTVGLDDQIIVPEPGHGILNVGTAIETDIYRDSELILTDARTEPGNALFAKFEQPRGCGKVTLQESEKARVQLDSGFGTITTLEPGTEFVVCHDPTLTCAVVVKGQVEVLAQGKVTRARAGEASFILKDEPPSPAICAHLDQLDLWTDQKEGTGQAPLLGDVVASWKQQSCAAATASAPATPAYPAGGSSVAPLPPGDGTSAHN
jgi:hypothetical protein